MEGSGPLCLTCAELDHLLFLGRGDAALTRRAKAESNLWAAVIRFSRSRRHDERHGDFQSLESPSCEQIFTLGTSVKHLAGPVKAGTPRHGHARWDRAACLASKGNPSATAAKSSPLRPKIRPTSPGERDAPARASSTPPCPAQAVRASSMHSTPPS